ncbi:MAG: hypothetical protein RQ739_16610, partial [Desulfotignum sp.]|nr:hypothetical protein [Desulfotignum sp.]
ALTARTMWKTGVYSVSRFPGYPLYEIINSVLINTGGWLLSNLFTCLVFLVSIFIFDAILKNLSSRHRILSVVLFVVIPFAAGYISRVLIVKKKGLDYFENVFIKKKAFLLFHAELILMFFFPWKRKGQN